MGNMSNRKLSFLLGEIFARGNNNDDIRVELGGMETLSVETKSNKKGKVRRFSLLPFGIGETRETKKDVRSREVSPYNRLGSLTYAEPPLHAISTTISLRLALFVYAPSSHSVLLLLFPFARDAPLRSVFA